MKHLIIASFAITLFLACKTNKPLTSTELTSNSEIITKFGSTINNTDVKKHVYALASDEFEGRQTGEKGQKLAANYLANEYKSYGIKGANGSDNYYQIIPVTSLKGKSKNPSENVIAYIEGTEKPKEIVVISSHYDHLGSS